MMFAYQHWRLLHKCTTFVLHDNSLSSGLPLCLYTAMRSTDIKKLASTLTYLGALPFVVCVIGIWFEIRSLPWVVIMLTYGAIILTFLAGIHWGVAVMRSGSKGMVVGEESRLLVWSNVVALCAWGVLLSPNLLISYAVLFLLFIAQWVVDWKMRERVWIPDWFYELRRSASFVAVASFTLVLVFVLLFS